MGAGIAAGPHCPRSRGFCRSLASRRGSGSGRGLSAPVGSLSGSLPKPKLPPGSQGDPSKRTSTGPFPGRRQSELCRSPESQKPNRSPTPASFRLPQKRTPEGPDRTACEANFADAPFADPSPEGPGSAGRLFGKWGRHRSEDLCLALLPRDARPWLSRHSRRFVAAAFGRFRNLVSPFPEGPPCRLPHRYARSNRFARVRSTCG